MIRLIVAMMAIAIIALSACSERTAQNVVTDQGAVNAELDDSDQSGIIKTEGALRSLIESTEAGQEKKNVTLVGTLELGSNPKLDPSKLIIGNASVYFGHYLDKDKYDKQTVLVKADILHADGKTWDAQVQGHMIVNVQQVEIIENP